MRQVQAGTADVSVIVRIVDSVDGTPEPGVVAAGVSLEYRRELAISVALTESNLAALTTAHTDGGFLAIGNGYYRVDLPDAACAVGATGVLVHGTGTGLVIIGEYIELVAYNPYDAAHLGLSTLSTLLSRIIGTLAAGTHPPQGGDNFARLGTPAGASVSADIATRLAPTVAGRTLDVTATGAAGVDWANVENPTTTVGLTNTTVGIVTLLNGLAANVVTATAIAADAITAAKIAANAIVDTKIATGAFTAAKFASGAFDAVWTVGTRELTAFSTALALSVWHVLESAIVTASTIGLKVKTNLDAVVSTRASQTSVDDLPTNAELATALAGSDDATLAAIAVVQADTDNLQTRLPAALISGRIDAHMGSVADAVLTAAKFASGAFDAVWEVTVRLLTAGTNIVLAKGTGVTGFNDLSAAQVNTEVDTALADAGLDDTPTLADLAETLVGPLVTVVADGGNTATSFKIDLGTLPTNGPMDAWLSFDLTTTTAALRGQVKRVASFNTTTDVITLASAYSTAPAAGDTARLVTR